MNGLVYAEEDEALLDDWARATAANGRMANEYFMVAEIVSFDEVWVLCRWELNMWNVKLL